MRQKLDPNAHGWMFIRYALTCKQYHLHDLVSIRLIVSRDVLFIDKEAYHLPAAGEQGERILHYIPASMEPAQIKVIQPASQLSWREVETPPLAISPPDDV